MLCFHHSSEVCTGQHLLLFVSIHNKAHYICPKRFRLCFFVTHFWCLKKHHWTCGIYSVCTQITLFRKRCWKGSSLFLVSQNSQWFREPYLYELSIVCKECFRMTNVAVLVLFKMENIAHFWKLSCSKIHNFISVVLNILFTNRWQRKRALWEM